MKGDGLQTGGMLIVSAESKVLLSHAQSAPGDHVSNEEILKALGIEGTPNDGAANIQPKMECNDDVCTMPTTASNKPKVECTDDVCALPPKQN